MIFVMKFKLLFIFFFFMILMMFIIGIDIFLFYFLSRIVTKTFSIFFVFDVSVFCNDFGMLNLEMWFFGNFGFKGMNVSDVLLFWIFIFLIIFERRVVGVIGVFGTTRFVGCYFC